MKKYRFAFALTLRSIALAMSLLLPPSEETVHHVLEVMELAEQMDPRGNKKP